MGNQNDVEVNLRDFTEGAALTPDNLQMLVNAVEKLADKTVRLLYRRNYGTGDNAITKDSADGDNLHMLCVTREVDRTVKSGADIDITLNFGMNFAKPPVLIPVAIAFKPVILSISNVTPDDAIVNVLIPGAFNEVTIKGITYVAIGPKAQGT